MPFDPTDPETKTALAAAIADAKEGQDAKNAELLGEVKKLKADLRKTQDIKPEDVAAIEAERDKALTDLATATKTAKDATTTADKATKALEAESGFTHKLLVENGLREQLASNGVTNPVHQKAAMAMLASQVAITADGDTRVAKVGDKVLADFVKEWSAGDEGKHFVAAPANSGTGAPGSTGTQGAGKTATRAAFDAMDQGSRASFAKEGGKVVDAAA
jgi:hypothetical protein